MTSGGRELLKWVALLLMTGDHINTILFHGSAPWLGHAGRVVFPIFAFVLAWNIEAVPDKFEELAHVCRAGGGGPGFVRWLGHLKQQIGITGTLSAHGVRAEHIPRLVEVASRDICHQTNPRPCTPADFQRFFEEAL